jgi:hypothetical protein
VHYNVAIATLLLERATGLLLQRAIVARCNVAAPALMVVVLLRVAVLLLQQCCGATVAMMALRCCD